MLLDKLTKAVSYYYRDDKISPSIIISSLKTGVYVSVVRYEESFAKGKKVICNARGTTIPTALKELATKFLQVSTTQNPVQELSNLVGKR